MLTLNFTIIRHLGAQIKCGDALQALFTLNEYLAHTAPLRSAFVTTAQPRLGVYPAELGSVVEAARAGKRLADLSTEQIEAFHARQRNRDAGVSGVTGSLRARPVVTPRPWREIRERRRGARVTGIIRLGSASTHVAKSFGR